LHPTGVNPIPEGSLLGEMTREYSSDEIVEFVSAGFLFKRKIEFIN
jgi:hypothetical protein